MAILAEISPLDPATGTRVALRVAANDDARVTGLNDVAWWPGIIASPVLRLDGWDGDFSGAAQIASASIQIDPVALRRIDSASPAYRWAGAPLKVWQGVPGATWATWKQIFVGLIEDYGTDESGRYSFSAQVDGEPFEANVLTLSYAGTGGIEGSADLKDKPKPMLLGRARNVEPVQIDAVNNVYQVHAYGAVSAISNIYERAADLVGNGGTNVGNFDTFATLVAAAIPEGSFGTCLAQGLFRLGAPPAGLITADVDGDSVSGFVRSTAAVIRRLCSIAGVPTARIDQTSLDALNAVVPYPINLYLTSPTKLIDIIQALARGCNAQAILSWSGLLRIVRFGAIPAAGATLDAQGRDLPPVVANQELKVSPPYWRIEMRGNRAWRPHSKDEVALIEPSVDWPDVTDSNGTKPEDNATVGAPSGTMIGGIIQPDGSAVGGVPAAQVVSDLDVALGSLLTEMLRNATYRGETDQVVYLPDGTPVRTVIQVLSALVDGATAYIADLRQVDGDGNLKAAIVLNSLGHITGVTQLNDGETGSYYVVADEFGFVDPNGGNPKKPLFYLDGKLYLDDVYIRKLDVGIVTTASIAAGSVTGSVSYSFGDVAIGASETTLAEVTELQIGSGGDGQALVMFSLTQDGSTTADTAVRLRAYVDVGNGYVLMRNKLSGIRTSGADTKWSLPVAFPISIMASGTAKIKLTAQGTNIAGGGSILGAFARDIQIDIFKGFR